MDTDKGLNSRFCWPTQDRARAESPSKAPRTSSVLTASVSFGSDSSVSGPRDLCSPRCSAPLSRAGSSPVWLRRHESHEVGCSCCKIGLPGQSRPFRKIVRRSARHLQVPTVPSPDAPTCWKGGVALGFSGAAPRADEDLTADLDWRVLGEQDPTGPFSVTPGDF